MGCCDALRRPSGKASRSGQFRGAEAIDRLRALILVGLVQQLNAALIPVMKAGPRTSFAERYRTLAPVIEQVFDLDGVLARSVGPTWDSFPAAQKEVLAKAFRRYTISSYLANFDSYDG